MPKIRIGKPKAATGSKPTTKELAEEAVQKFESEYETLVQMKEEWEASFPDASQALQDILQQEDVVREAVKTAHPLVQAAKETIGDFKCARKWSKPGYDDALFTNIINEAEDGGDIVKDLLKVGVVKTISLDKSAVTYFAQNPELSEAFKEAWKDKEEKTAAVTVPKF